MAAEQLPVQSACNILGVSDAGYYAWLKRGPSARAVRHLWLTGVITEVHAAARGVYGSRRVHAELQLGRGIFVSLGAVELLMNRAGIQGLPGPGRPRARPQTATAEDLVDRRFARREPNQLWVTDITEHPTREGKIYCCVVLDVFSRKVVGWSIDSSQTASLVTNALSMALQNRNPTDATIIHSDHGVQGGLNWSSQHLDGGGCDGQASGMDDCVDGSVGDEVAWCAGAPA
jgi:putative transposase